MSFPIAYIDDIKWIEKPDKKDFQRSQVMNQKRPMKHDKPMFNSLKQKWKKEKHDRHFRSKEARKILIEEGQDIFKEFKIKKVILFGSVLQNRMSAMSDVDILVDPLSAEQFFRFQCQLEERLNLTVDLHTMNEDRKFIEKIIKRGEVVYEI